MNVSLKVKKGGVSHLTRRPKVQDPSTKAQVPSLMVFQTGKFTVCNASIHNHLLFPDFQPALLLKILYITFNNLSISPFVVGRPKVNLKLPVARSSEKPRDFKTCDGWQVRAVQAAPGETAKPAKSSLIIKSCPDWPGK